MSDPLRSVLDRAAPEPPRSVDVDAVWRGADRRRAQARRRVTVGASVATVAAAALAVALATLLPASSPTLPSPPLAAPNPQHPTSTAPPMPTTEGNRTQTIVALDRILAQLPVYPGSRVATKADHPYLTGPLEFPAGAIDRGRTRLTHGSVAEARRYIRAHLPAGVVAAESGTMGGPDIPTTQSDSVTGPSTWQQPDAFTALTVSFGYAIDHQGRLEIRTDVQAVPLAARTADQRVATPGQLRVELTQEVHRFNSAVHHMHSAMVTGSRAKQLAGDLNALKAQTFTEHSCPAITYTITTTMRFYPDYDSRGGVPFAVAVVSSSACGTDVTIGRGPRLVGDARLNADLDTALGH